MDFLVYSISFLFGLGLLGFCVIFASFTKYASSCETEKHRCDADFARMLHGEGIPRVGGGRVVRTKGRTFQLTKAESHVFFASLPDSIIQLLANSGSARVLYLGGAKGEEPSIYPIFNVVSIGEDGPMIDTIPFSPSAPGVQAIARRYDQITQGSE